MVLSQIVLSGPQPGSEGLYYRLVRGSYDARSGRMAAGTVLDMDTYFNAFSASAFARYGLLDRVHVQLDADRDLRITLAWGDGSERTKSGREIAFSVRECGGRVGLRVEAEADCVFRGGYYWTDEPPVRKPRLSIVICSYRREAYVARTLDSLAPLLGRDVQVYLIDNGGTLPQAVGGTPWVHLVRNPNLGGSGGFSRGFYETLRAPDGFTHILLMDDDIVLECGSIQKLLAFLAFLGPEHGDVQVAGGMLSAEKPTLQIENTGRWEGRNASNKAGLDLATQAALAENEQELAADYAAWWFLCLPVNNVRQAGYALPLFLKCDDSEYGMRLGTRIVTLNGVGVWHEDFSTKFDRVTDYYITRNTMILSALVDGRRCTPIMQRIYALRCYQTVVLGDGKLLEYVRQGLSDYLRGPAFLEGLHAQSYHQKLREGNARVPFVALSGAAKLKALLPRVFSMDFLKATGAALSGMARLMVNNGRVASLWRDRRDFLGSEEYWRDKWFEQAD